MLKPLDESFPELFIERAYLTQEASRWKAASVTLKRDNRWYEFAVNSGGLYISSKKFSLKGLRRWAVVGGIEALSEHLHLEAATLPSFQPQAMLGVSWKGKEGGFTQIELRIDRVGLRLSCFNNRMQYKDGKSIEFLWSQINRDMTLQLGRRVPL